MLLSNYGALAELQTLANDYSDASDRSGWVRLEIDDHKRFGDLDLLQALTIWKFGDSEMQTTTNQRAFAMFK